VIDVGAADVDQRVEIRDGCDIVLIDEVAHALEDLVGFNTSRKNDLIEFT